ncbi:MAG: DUF4198 domain-containing protein [Alphaproteobacteria bacterium]|jgi:hypothetical protein|nr:DUF4198 domain-containing protein [Alphaproteobacteria bacterium]
MRILALLACMLASPAIAHELWIEPGDYQLRISENIVAEIKNGEDFEGYRLPYLPKDFEHFVILGANQVAGVVSRLGDRPAIDQAAPGSGLNIIVYESRPSTISYDSFEKFEAFAINHGVDDMAKTHFARGLASGPFAEVYTRYSKALVSVGTAQGQDRHLGLEAELVALENPYLLKNASHVRVQLFFKGAPVPKSQVELYSKGSLGEVRASIHHTDADGIANLRIEPGFAYMVNAVIYRQPHERHLDTNAVWETLWANLTFAVPN